MIKDFFADRVIKYGIYLGGSIFLAGLVVLVITYSRLQPVIPLFYNRQWGQDQLTSPLFFFALLIGSFFVFAINVVIANYFCKDKALLSRMLIWIGILCILLAVITIIKTIIITI